MKKVPAAEAHAEEKVVAPKFRRTHNPGGVGEEHPSGPVPPRPQDFVPEDTPHAFVQRLKTTPKG